MFRRFLEFNRARVLNFLDAGNVIVTKAINMDTVVLIQVGAAHIAVEADRVLVLVLRRLDDIKPVSDHVGMLHPPAQVLDLLDCDEPCKIVHLSLGVATIGL